MPTTAAVAFFLAQAGYSYNPATETPEQGKQRRALELANAEEQGRDAGLSFSWQRDTDADTENEWLCVCYSREGQTVGALGGIDIGNDDPHGSDYRRVVEAELAYDHLTA